MMKLWFKKRQTRFAQLEEDRVPPTADRRRGLGLTYTRAR